MARAVFTSTKGFTELGNNMRSLTAQVNKKICGKATGKGAQVIKRAVVRLAPVSSAAHTLEDGTIVQPGNLKKNIIVKKIKSPLTSEHIVTVRSRPKGNQKGAPYAHFDEFGTVKMSPRPFMRPGFDSNKEAAVEAIRSSLDEGIQKAVAALPKTI